MFAGGTRGIGLDRDTTRLTVVDITDGDTSGVLVHDETNKVQAQLLVDMRVGEFPVALGVLYCNPAPTFDAVVTQQNSDASVGKVADFAALVRKGQTWEVNQKQPHVI